MLQEYKISNKALELYKEYREKKSSGAIAKPVSLGVVMDLCDEIKPKTILEIGAGMGTLTEAMLRYSDAHIDAYEPDEFCREKMNEHLYEFQGRYRIINSYRTLPPRKEYDLIVVDGGTRKGKDGGYTKMIWLFLHSLDDVKLIYVEGNRALQRIMIRKALKTRFTYKITRFKPMEHNGESLPGGTRFDVKKEPLRVKRIKNFVFWELKEKRAIKYIIRYHIRCLKKRVGLK